MIFSHFFPFYFPENYDSKAKKKKKKKKPNHMRVCVCVREEQQVKGGFNQLKICIKGKFKYIYEAFQLNSTTFCINQEIVNNVVSLKNN